MATMNVSLPDDMKAFVEAQAAKRGFSTVSEYMRDLIRDAQERQTDRDRIDALLLQGLESGPAKPWTAADWESIRGALPRQPGPRS